MIVNIDKNKVLLKDEDIYEIKKQYHIELSQRSFYHYCRSINPKFFKKKRKYLKQICDSLQDFYFNDKKCFIISLPPRHGKSYIMTLFTNWLLGINSGIKIITVCYDYDLSSQFSRQVRDRIQLKDNQFSLLTNQDIFPNCQIKKGDGAYDIWSLSGQSQRSYMAARVNGAVNGKGADIIVCDDTIRDAEEAYNNDRVEKINKWFDEVLMTRREGLKKIIVVMTRYRENDLAGYVHKLFSKEEIQEIVMPAYDSKSEEMLCEELLNKIEYDRIMKNVTDVKLANYQQICRKFVGRLYIKGFRDLSIEEYDNIKSNIVRRECYVDTADRGKDYLCALIYDVVKTPQEGEEAIVIDVLYTQDPTEITEEKLVSMLYKHSVNKCWIEGNNGGSIFARNVKKILSEKYKTNKCLIKDFHQSKNKESRILSQSGWVQEHIMFIKGWSVKFTKFFEDLYNYSKSTKNEHDDAQDCITGIAEMIQSGNKKVGAVNIK